MAKLSYLVKYQQVRQRAFPRVDRLKGACKDKIRMERISWDKHSSLFCLPIGNKKV
jgi:hypothetical protein